MATKKDLAFDHFMGVSENPKKRKAVSAKSQVTGKPPTKRLKKRRAKNTEPGYFPNPIDAAKIEFEVQVYKAIKAAHTKSATKILAQAKLSYAQGMITAGHMLKIFTPAESQLFIMQLKDDGVIGR